MKKSKLAIGIMTAILTAGTLAGCDNVVKYSADGKIITYKEGNNPAIDIKADDLLEDYYKDSSKFQSIFDAINSIVVRNYFEKDPFIEEVDVISKDKDGKQVTTKKQLGKPQMVEIEAEAAKRVGSDKNTAQTNADNNGTSYSDEFNSILSSKGAKDEKELKEKYIEEVKKEFFEDNFYKYHIEDIKTGDDTIKYDGDKQLWNGYFKDMVPYHVSHILVKLEDGSGTNYANGTISEANAKKLFNVVNELADKNNIDSFGTIAKRYSEDTGSAANFGDLGIMDYSTGYVNEFKLGIYAYENFLGGNKDAVLTSNINIPGNSATASEVTGIAKSFQDVSVDAFGAEIPEIPFSVFKDLYDVAEIDKDANGKPVIDDSANFYPRNIVYNKYLNRHSVALITVPDADDHILTDAEKETKGTGFVTMSIAGVNKNVLSVKTASGWTPILCVRAGSDYQGIHFIIVNRSAFDTNASVSLSDYYTTYYPDQDAYPIDEAGNPKATYVNFDSRKEASDTKPRAESLLSTFKSYDSERLNKYIFQRFFNEEGIKVKNEQLAQILTMWVTRGLDKKEQEKDEAWEKTWNDYIDTLRKQNDERSKLVSNACKIAYLNGNGLDASRNDVKLSTIMSSLTAELVGKEIDPKTGELFADDAAAEKYILSIRIGSEIKYNAFDGDDLVSVLFKTEGALCNDGKEHL